MYALTKFLYGPSNVQQHLLCVSDNIESLVHHYNCLDRSEIKGKKIFITPFEDSEVLKVYLGVRYLRKNHFTIEYVEKV